MEMGKAGRWARGIIQPDDGVYVGDAYGISFSEMFPASVLQKARSASVSQRASVHGHRGG